MSGIDEFVARANIEHFKRKLATETDEVKRKTLLTLLAEEEAKLAALKNDSPDNQQRRS